MADSSKDIEIIIRACESDLKLKVVARAKSGLDIISFCTKSKIDVVVMTTRLDMGTDRILSRLMTRLPTPVLILQDTYDTTRYGKEFDFGLIDKILVNFNKGGIVINEVSMTTRIQILSKLKIEKFSNRLNNLKKSEFVPKRSIFSTEKSKPVNLASRIIAPIPKGRRVIIIGASTGGPRLLSKLIPFMPVNLPPIIIVQHIPVGFIDGFAKRLSKTSQIRVKMASHGDIIKSGTIYIAPGGKHLRLNPRGTLMPRIDIFDDKPVNYVKPSVDVTLKSAVEIFGKDVVSVILTGMGVDGLEGSKFVKNAGGSVIALNKEDADIYGMNKAVINAGITDKILPASGIVRGIIDVIRGK